MSFGENSGIASGGIGQGFAQGAQAINQSVEQKKTRDLNEQHYHDQMAQYQDGVVRQKDTEDRSAAQNALGIYVNQFNGMAKPVAPAGGTPEEWDQYTKDITAYDTQRMAIGQKVDALMGVTVGVQKNPDGTPITTQGFHELATGMTSQASAALLADRSKAGSQLTDLNAQLKTIEGQITQAVQAGGGTDNNPEYDRLKGLADGLVKQITPLYEKISGQKFTGTVLDYGKLTATARVQSGTQIVLSSLKALATSDPTIGAAFDAATKSGQALSYGTKMSELGVQGDDRTLGQVIKSSTLAANVDSLVSSNPEQAAAVVMAMTPEERAANPKAQEFFNNLVNPPEGAAGDGYRSYLSSLNLKPAQVKQVLASTTLTVSNITAQDNVNDTFVFAQAQKGDPGVLSKHDAYVANLTAPGPDGKPQMSPERAEAAWDSVMGAYQNAKKTTDDNLTLLDQAVTAGDAASTTAVGTLISNGQLYIQDLAGMTGKLKDKLGTGYQAALDASKHAWEMRDGSDQNTLDIQVAQLKGVKFQNDLNEQLRPYTVSKAKSDAGMSDDTYSILHATMGTKIASENNQAFLSFAQQGTAFLNSPNVQKLAKENGVDLSVYADTAKFVDWTRADTKRSSNLREFLALIDNPDVALSSKNSKHLQQLSSDLGINFGGLMQRITDAKTNKTKLDAAQLNQILSSSTIAQSRLALDKQGQTFTQNLQTLSFDREGRVIGFNQGMDTARFKREGLTIAFSQDMQTRAADLNDDQFGFSKTSWRAGYNLSVADHDLNVMKFKYGKGQDELNNQFRLMQQLDQHRISWAGLAQQERSSLREYIGIVRSAGQDARALGQQYQGMADTLSKESNVQVALNANAVQIGSDGQAFISNKTFQNANTAAYVAAMNNAHDYFAAAGSSVTELGGIKKSLNGSAVSPQEKDDVGAWLENALGQSGVLPPQTIKAPNTIKGPAAGSITPAFRTQVEALPGRQKSLMSAVLDMADNGAFDARGNQIATDPGQCSKVLRLITEKAGIPTGKYFGGTAQETWGLVKKNGIVLNGGAQLTPADMSKLQPGDLIYQNTPQGAQKLDYDHVAMYIGNGQVFQNSLYSNDGPVKAGGALGVMSLSAYVQSFPSYAGRMTELNTVASPSGAPVGPQQPGVKAPAVPARAGTTGPVAAPVKTGAGVPLPGTGGLQTFTQPKMVAGTFKPNVTVVSGRDLLAAPTGKPGQYNVYNNSGAAVATFRSYGVQAAKIYGTQYTSLPVSQRRDFLSTLMKSQGFQGDFTKLGQMAIPDGAR